MINDSAEEWRPIPGLAGYDVSNIGRIRSHKRGRTRIMSAFTDSLGYVRLTCGGQRVLVHRAVAAAFYGPCPEGKEVDHINRVRNDNHVENLRYVTHKQNMNNRVPRRPLTECSKGHPLSGENLYVRPDGRRECRICAIQSVQKIRNVPDPCSYAACQRPAYSRRTTDFPICEMHYQRERKDAKRLRQTG